MLKFTKISATGNDFIVIDNRKLIYAAENKSLWEKLCTRRTNIGADGVLLVEPSEHYDFKMRYINADGGEVSMCGNGGRAISSFYYMNIDDSKRNLQFETMNGVYKSYINEDNSVRLQMTELSEINMHDISPLFSSEKSLYLNTGAPHCVYEVSDVNAIDVFNSGKKVRENPMFSNGTNVNFFSVKNKNTISVRTYERGVEDETLSCGTGITAAAISYTEFYGKVNTVYIESLGGELAVEFDKNEIYLVGGVNEIFVGSCSV